MTGRRCARRARCRSGHPADLELDAADRTRVAEDRVVGQRVAAFARWAEAGRSGAARRLHLHFRRSPVEIVGAGRAEAVRLRDNVSGVVEELAVGAVVTAVGYRCLGVPGLPVDAGGGASHVAGRIEPGLYVAGWLKHGPNGVIGTNKACAVGTVRSLWQDVDAGRLGLGVRTVPSALIRSRRTDVVDWSGWTRIDAAELTLGAATGRVRTKITEFAELVRLGAGGPALVEEAR